jgi:hypothetical protein
VAGRLAAHLTEFLEGHNERPVSVVVALRPDTTPPHTYLEVVDGDIVAGEVEHAVEEGAGVTVGEHEPVAVHLRVDTKEEINNPINT